ncbi:HEAT repeat domain-containing protein [Methanobacterium sp. MBAC-LM]|uniref:HEAT repeat domain-containing protein n=1 Tax=Methanobacterium sp. MBAC-LM TaxID=3412034 RepID=UPI003C75D3FE
MDTDNLVQIIEEGNKINDCTSPDIEKIINTISEIKKSRAKKSIETLIKTKKLNKCRSVKQSATNALNEIMSKKSTKSLLNFLFDNNSDIRSLAVESIGEKCDFDDKIILDLLIKEDKDLINLYIESNFLGFSRKYMNRQTNNGSSEKGFIDESFRWESIRKENEVNFSSNVHPFNYLNNFVASLNDTEKAQLSIESIKKLWSIHKKMAVVEPYGEWVMWESLHSISHNGYRDHIIHQLNVFLVGNSIFEISESSFDYYLPWLLTSTFHDFAYPIEMLGSILNWMVSFTDENIGIIDMPLIESFNASQPSLGFNSQIDQILYYFKEYHNLTRVQESIWKEFIRYKLDGYKISIGDRDIRRRDHGVIAGIIIPQRIKTALRSNSASWIVYNEDDIETMKEIVGYVESWYHSSLGIIFHNFRGTKDIDDFINSRFFSNLNSSQAIERRDIVKALSFNVKKYPLIPLLWLTDEIQNWGRPNYTSCRNELGSISESIVSHFEYKNNILEIGICYKNTTSEETYNQYSKLEDKFKYLDYTECDSNCFKIHLTVNYFDDEKINIVGNPIEIIFPKNISMPEETHYGKISEIYKRAFQ